MFSVPSTVVSGENNVREQMDKWKERETIKEARSYRPFYVEQQGEWHDIVKKMI